MLLIIKCYHSLDVNKIFLREIYYKELIKGRYCKINNSFVEIILKLNLSFLNSVKFKKGT